MSVDFGYGVRGLARFRCNIYMQRGTIAACFRRIPYQIKSLEELELPPVLLEFCELPDGPRAGHRADRQRQVDHARGDDPLHHRAPAACTSITIEDPIEFLFTDDVASISQREVGTDTARFNEALRNAMRQDPDVIMVGEMRDPETVSTVITAAETGHLVFSTLHTNSAAADGRPHPRHLPVRPAEADPRAARAGPQGRRLDEAGRAARTARA